MVCKYFLALPINDKNTRYVRKDQYSRINSAQKSRRRRGVMFYLPGQIINLLIIKAMVEGFHQNRHHLIDRQPRFFEASLRHFKASITTGVDAVERLQIHINI